MPIFQVDAFTSKVFDGNPAAVCPLDFWLEDETLQKIARLAETGKEALENKDYKTFGKCINENFDLRKQIMQINESNLEMITTARSCGASAKFAGSGGSIIGTYTDDDMLTRLIVELKKINARVIKPYIV